MSHAGNRWVAGLVRLYPARFRAEYGPGVRDMAIDRIEAGWRAGAVRGVTTVIGESVGLIIGAVREHFHGRPPRHGMSRYRGTRGVGRFLIECRHAARRLRRAPGFTFASVVTLGLGIGANTAIFGVVRGVILKPLPYPDDLELVWLDHGAAGIGVERGLGMTSFLYRQYRDDTAHLGSAALHRDQLVTIQLESGPYRAQAALATSTLLDVLRVPPALGRWFTEEELAVQGAGFTVLGHGLWARQFGSDPAVVGRTLVIDGASVLIIGIMPADFQFPGPDTELWLPVFVPERDRFGGFNWFGVGRLASGSSVAELRIELDRLVRQAPERVSDPVAAAVVTDAKLNATPMPLREHVVGSVRQTIWVLFGTVGFILLLACANVANLFLVRAETRQREVAVRTALGASRSELLAFFLAESAVLTGLGVVTGLVVAWAGVEGLLAAAPSSIPRLHEVGLDATVLIFTGLVSVVVCILFGLVPASRRIAVANALRDGARGSSASRSRMQVRHALAVVQIALTLVLLVGSGLMLKSFVRLMAVDPGFTTAKTLTFEVGLPAATYGSREEASQFHAALLDELRGLPGVEMASATTCLPLSGWCGGDPLVVAGRPGEPGEIPPVVAFRSVSEDYFRTVGMPVLAGRTLTRADRTLLTDVVLVNRTLAEAYFPEGDAIGQRVSDIGSRSGDADPRNWYTIVGIVGDTPAISLERGGDPQIYFPMRSRDDRGSSIDRMQYTVRAEGETLGLGAPIRDAVRRLDATVPVAGLRPLDAVLANATVQPLFTTWLLGLGAVLALILGFIGVYGVISYIVAARRNEIGVRIALGASGVRVRREVLRLGAGLAGIGIVLGLGVAMGLTRFMRGLLFTVAPTDPLTFLVVSVGLTIVTGLACAVPAWRASRVDPMIAMRTE